MHLEPNDYQIYYVNIDLHHQYGISVTESQTFPPRKKFPLAKSEEKQLFLQAMDRFSNPFCIRGPLKCLKRL